MRATFLSHSHWQGQTIMAWSFTALAVALGAVAVAYLLLRRWIQGPDCPDQTTRMDGKTVIITGCNTGIGYETALALALRGARLIMACRDLARAEPAAQRIRDAVAAAANGSSKDAGASQQVSVMQLDLCSFASVRAFAAAVARRERKVDVLLCNAGAMMMQQKLTGDGIETALQANHLSHFLLCSLLLPLLKAAPRARVICVSSLLHKYAKSPPFDDMNHDKSYRGFEVYGETKLANVLFANELGRRLKDTNITTCSLHPGSVVSDIPRHLPGLVRHLYPLYAHAFCKTTCKGAQTSICAAVDPRFDAVTGVYLDDCAIVPASAVACDVGVAKRLWDVSEQLTGAQWQF